MAGEQYQRVSVDMVRELIDFTGSTISSDLAELQLHGATAIYNKLVSQKESVKVSYLADEVGMGKTYIALGVLSIMRHFRPNMRVVVIAPRHHMQTKWIRDQRNFTKNNYRLDDLAVRNDMKGPVRPFQACSNLVDFAHRSVLEHDHDFILRMSSFSLAVSLNDESGDESRQGGKQRYEELIGAVLGSKALADLNWSKQPGKAKRKVGEAINRLLRPIDLLIVDEAHNLKHGAGDKVAFRNQVLQEVFAKKVEHVLLMSATPVESSYRELFNQLEVFGAAKPYEIFNDGDAERDDQKRKAKEMLVRRVYSLRTTSGRQYTRNQYRREWRGGGVVEHDKGMAVERTSERLIMGLMQLKVQEALGKTRYPHSFQMGLLASFESYGQTVANKDANLFQPEDGQPRAVTVMEGADVGTINGIADRYRKLFNHELPHPKMDAVRLSLETCWDTGEKALVFVRRIASATELVNRLNEYHDGWLIKRLKDLLPDSSVELGEAYGDYSKYKQRMVSATRTQAVGSDDQSDTKDDEGDETIVRPVAIDDDEDMTSFFSWFFRSTSTKSTGGKPTWRTGGWLQTRLNSTSSSMSTIFLFNDVADLLNCEPEQIEKALALATNTSVDTVREEIRKGMGLLLPKDAERYETFLRTQSVAIRYLKDHAVNTEQSELVNALYDLKYQRYEAILEDRKWKPEEATAPEKRGRKTRIDNAMQLLSEDTLWSRMRTAGEAVFAPIIAALSPSSDQQQLLQREIAREIMTGALRRSHAAIDLYGVVMNHYDSLKITKDNAQDDVDGQAIVEDLVSHLAVPADGTYRAINELLDIAENLKTIIELNIDLGKNAVDPLRKIRKVVGNVIRNVSPSSDMTGGAPDRLIKQFRLPGYPFVLVATDVISEGQDLHTFCRNVYHYGVAWMPSGMEQRTGRIDRVNSRTERRLKGITSDVDCYAKLQVYLPYLKDTIEVVQMHRVLTRMNIFLEALHDDLQIGVAGDDRRIDLKEAISMDLEMPPQIVSTLRSTFDIDADKDLVGSPLSLRVDQAKIAKRQKSLSSILDAVTKNDEIMKRDSGYVSARRRISEDNQKRTQNYRCQVGEHHGLTTIVCKSLAAVLPIDEAATVMKVDLKDGVRIMNGDQPDTDRFDCWVIGEIYVDTDALQESIAAVDRLIDNVVRTAQLIDDLDGIDNDAGAVVKYDEGGSDE